MDEEKNNVDLAEIACKYGYYPYCPTCEHGYVYQEEWMLEDNCVWVCLLDQEKPERVVGRDS